jgi:SAM-dependent methyltransferase
MRKLEIGSGNRPAPGYEHADANPDCPSLDYVCEMDAIPVVDDTFDEVRTVHVIEHIGLPRARRALAEWRRILKPEGLCHIDTPNIERNATLYLNGGWLKDFNSLLPAERELCSLDGVPDRTLWLNFKVFSTDGAWNTHYWNAAPDLLLAMCREAGFARVQVVQSDPSLIVHAWK